MGKHIIITEAQLKRLEEAAYLDNYEAEGNDNFLQPTFMSIDVRGKSYVMHVDYHLEGSADEEGGELFVEIRYEPTTNDIRVGGTANEEMKELAKQDFIRRFDITEDGMGLVFPIHGNITNVQGHNFDWDAEAD